MALARRSGARADPRLDTPATRQPDEEFVLAFDHRTIAESQQDAAQRPGRDPRVRRQLGISGKASDPRAATGCGREPIEPVRPQRQPVQHAPADRGVERGGQIRGDRDRPAVVARAGKRRDGAAVVDRPEQRPEPHRIGAEQRLDINGLFAEPDAEPAERTPARRVERGKRRRDILGRETAERAGELEHDAAPGAAERQRLGGEERRQAALDLVLDVKL